MKKWSNARWRGYARDEGFATERDMWRFFLSGRRRGTIKRCEVAYYFGYTPQTIINRLKRNKVSLNKPGGARDMSASKNPYYFSRDVKFKIEELFAKGMTGYKICHLLKVSKAGVYRYIKRVGLKR